MACQLLTGLTSAGRAFYGTFQCRPASLKTCKMNESVIWSAGCRGQPPATPRAWHRHFPPSRGPRGPEEAPDLAHHQEWTMGMQRPKLEGGLCAAAQAAGKRDQEK